MERSYELIKDYEKIKVWTLQQQPLRGGFRKSSSNNNRNICDKQLKFFFI